MSIVPTGGLSMLRNMAVSGLRTNGTPCMRTVCTVAAGVGVGVGFGFGLFGFPLSPPPPQLPSSADAATAAMTDQSLDDIRTITIRLRTTWGVDQSLVHRARAKARPACPLKNASCYPGTRAISTPFWM